LVVVQAAFRAALFVIAAEIVAFMAESGPLDEVKPSVATAEFWVGDVVGDRVGEGVTQ